MTTYTPITPKDSREIQNKFVAWLNDHLVDPYEQSTNKQRNSFVFGDDFTLVGIWPKIHVDIADYVPNKIAVQSKTAYLEEEEHHFIIYYYNQKAHNYTFEDGQKLSNEAQCRKYLGYIHNLIKTKADKFKEYCHNITFGTIPKPTFNSTTSTYISMLLMTVYTYRR